MRHDVHPHHPEQVDASHGFELRDIVLPTIIKWVLFLFVFMAFSAVIALGTYKIFIPYNTSLATDTPMRPQRMEPPKPQLQAYPKAEMRDFRADEDVKVGDKDKAAGHLPIDDALKLTAQRLPTQKTTTGSVGPAYDPTGDGRQWATPQPVGTEDGYKPPVVYRKYPY